MIGLFFGESKLPLQILKKVKKKKKKYLIIDLTKNKNFNKNKFSYNVSLGQFGKIIDILKENKCTQVLFAGKVKKPNFSRLKLDLKGLYYIPKIIKCSKLGDAAILKEIINILEKEKIKTLNSLAFNPELSLKRGTYTKIKPNKKDIIDINKAIFTLQKLNKYNFSQASVSQNNKIIAIEGREGTAEMLSKCKIINHKPSGVLVKLPKKKQDLRIDLPTIGIDTFVQCKRAGLKGIVLKSMQNIFLERKKCINFANKNKMFVIAK